MTFARRFPGSRHLARFDGTVKKVYFVFEPHHVTVHLSEYPHLALKCSIGIAVESGLLARSPTTLGVDMLDAAVSEGKRFHILAVKLRSEEELTILSAKCE